MTKPLDLKIKDDFFNQKELNNILNVAKSTPMFPRTNKEGLYGFRNDFKRNKDNQWIFDKIKKEFNLDEKLKPMENQLSIHLRNNHHKELAHTDLGKYIFLCYLDGEELFYNGTGFYAKSESMNVYVGFIKNRALFFNGKDILHTDLQSLGKSSLRYSLNIFYDD